MIKATQDMWQTWVGIVLPLQSNMHWSSNNIFKINSPYKELVRGDSFAFTLEQS